MAGRLDTELIERTLDGLAFRAPDFVAAALILDALDSAREQHPGPWSRHDGWRVGAPAASVYRLRAGDATATVSLLAGDGSVEFDGATARVHRAGTTTSFRFARDGDRLHLAQDGAAWTVTDVRFERATSAAAGANPELRSPMPGSVVAVFAEDGAPVQAGDPVLSIEAMKMEHVLKASGPGTVSLLVQVGDQVTGDQVVATIEGSTE